MKLKYTALATATLSAIPAISAAHHGALESVANASPLGWAMAGVTLLVAALMARRAALREWLVRRVERKTQAVTVHAHCDGPCGVYDPASARIAAEAVLSMTNKMLALEMPAASDAAAMQSYLNTFSRYSAIKEEQAQLAKDELLVLWTDYFKPPHLEQFPDLHDTFWQAAKCCSACKVELSAQHAKELMANIEKIHGIFWKSKSRDVAYYTAA